MRSIFDVEQQRSAGRAVLFYLGHLIIALITGGCAGIMVGLTTHAESRHLASHYAGLLVGIIYSGVLCVSLIRRRNLALYYYGLVPLVLGIAAVFGGIAGLVISCISDHGGWTVASHARCAAPKCADCPQRGIRSKSGRSLTSMWQIQIT